MNLLARTLQITTGLALASIPLLAQANAVGAVYTTTNATPQNELVVFQRSASGALTSSESIPTGGAGTGAGLGSDHAVQVGPEGRFLMTVNAGSNTVSLFDLTGAKPKLVSVANSGGLTPNSIALAHNRFYVLNSGAPASVEGFDISSDGLLRPIPGSEQFLSVPAPDAPQIGFSAQGFLFVTEKTTNSIDIFTAHSDGSLSPAFVQPSAGATPFGFVFDHLGHMIVTEAQGTATGASTVSSYDISQGPLQVVATSVPDYQTAACWIVLTETGYYFYVANTDSDDISEYQTIGNGLFSLVGNGVAAALPTGSKPADLALSSNSQFLYVVNSGVGTITGWTVAADGSLKSIGTFGSLPVSITGLAAN